MKIFTYTSVKNKRGKIALISTILCKIPLINLYNFFHLYIFLKI